MARAKRGGRKAKGKARDAGEDEPTQDNMADEQMEDGAGGEEGEAELPEDTGDLEVELQVQGEAGQDETEEFEAEGNAENEGIGRLTLF